MGGAASVGLRYDLGQGHPLTGRSAPDFVFEDGRRLGARLEAGRGLLLDFGAGRPLQALADACRGRNDHVPRSPTDALGLSALLVRPDGVVAWATDVEPDLNAAAQAAKRWFGAA